MKRFGILVAFAALTKLSYAGPDMGALVDYEKNDMEEAVAAEKAELSEKKESSLKDEQRGTQPLVSGLKDVSDRNESLPANLIFKEKDASKKSHLEDDLAARLAASTPVNGNELELDSNLTSTSPVLQSSTSQPLGIYFGFALTGMASNSKSTATILSEKSGNDRQIGFTLKIGYDIVDNLSVEFRGTHGMVNHVITPKFDNLALYLKPHINLLDDINFYVLLGYGRSNLTGISSKVGFTYGTGVKYSTLGNSEIFADAINYLEKKGTNSMWGYNLGIEFKF